MAEMKKKGTGKTSKRKHSSEHLNVKNKKQRKPTIDETKSGILIEQTELKLRRSVRQANMIQNNLIYTKIHDDLRNTRIVNTKNEQIDLNERKYMDKTQHKKENKSKEKMSVNMALSSERTENAQVLNFKPTDFNDLEPMCRVCWAGKSESSERLIKPCLCSGTIALIHPSCLFACRLNPALESSENRKFLNCNTCNHEYTYKRSAIIILRIFVLSLLIILPVSVLILLLSSFQLASSYFGIEENLRELLMKHTYYNSYFGLTLLSIFTFFFGPLFGPGFGVFCYLHFYANSYLLSDIVKHLFAALDIICLLVPITVSFYFSFFSTTYTVCMVTFIYWFESVFSIFNCCGYVITYLGVRVETEMIDTFN